MKTLIIARHGKAVEGEPGQPDILRELSPRGMKDIKVITRELKNKNLLPGLIFSSPAIRAVQTGRDMVTHFDEPGIKLLTSDSLYGNFSNEIFSFINSVAPEEKTVMIVGHNPSLLIMIEYLCAVVLVTFPTLATIVLDFEVERWEELNEKKGTIRKLFIPSELRYSTRSRLH